RIDSVASKIVALVPLPNNNLNAAGKSQYVNNYLEATDYYQNIPSFDVKIDQYQGHHDHIEGRLSFMDPTTFQAPAYGLAGGPASGGFEATGTDKTYSSDINWDHIFSPTLIVQNRIGLNRYRNTSQETDYGSTASTAIGIPGVNVAPFESGLTGIFIQSTTSDPLVGYSASLPWIRSETDFDFVSNWNKIIGNHTLTWGGNLIRIRDDLLQEQTYSPRGAWDFAPGETSTPGASENFANNFASFLLDVPNVVGRDLALDFPAYRATQLFLYGNDKWQVDPKLTVNLGLRWEWYPPGTPHFAGGFSNYDPANNTLVIAGVGGNPLNGGMQQRYHDFAPRVGLAYRLTHKDVVRAGFGISYEPYEDNTYMYDYPVKQNNAFNPLSGYGPALYPNGTPVTFEQGFPAPLVATVPSNGILSASTPLLLNQSYQVINQHYVDPYIESWNFAYERALPGQFTLDVAYVGNRGVHVPVQYNLNAVTNPADIGLNTAGQPEFTAFGRTASTTLYFAGESSDYNALQVEFNRRFSGGLSITTSYTYGKALGYAEENGDNSSSLNYYVYQQRNYAPTDFDRTHNFVQSYVWDLPFGAGHSLLNSGAASRLLGGWQVTGVLRFMTGATMNFGCTCAPLNTPGNSQSPWQTGPITKLKGVDTQPWFTTDSFADPTKLFGKPTFGDVGLYSMYGPNIFDIDAALFRTFKLSERFNLQLRTDWFAATNTPQFSNPGSTFGSSTFGLITGASGNRTIDVGAKLNF
ncbi:MAG: TonB-dependent receptor domain-containing protein, partial [Terriglobia bacterium]